MNEVVQIRDVAVFIFYLSPTSHCYLSTNAWVAFTNNHNLFVGWKEKTWQDDDVRRLSSLTASRASTVVLGVFNASLIMQLFKGNNSNGSQRLIINIQIRKSSNGYAAIFLVSKNNAFMSLTMGFF